jgi:hypothetical protein
MRTFLIVLFFIAAFALAGSMDYDEAKRAERGCAPACGR